MTGIYKITNTITKKVYIGLSNDIEQRWKTHKKRYKIESDKEYEKYLYRSFRKYGLEAFTFEVIEECPPEELSNREIYWISYYDSYANGYNETPGGEIICVGGEKHPNHKLTTQDIYFIRECYKQHFEKNKVYEMYKERINKTGFHKIWNNQTWKNIHQDVYTEENRQYYLYKRNSHPGSKNPRALLNETDVYNIRLRRKNGEGMKEVYQDYKHTGITEGSFKNTWYYRNWKNIVV